MLAIGAYVFPCASRQLLFSRKQAQGTANKGTSRLATSAPQALHAPQQVSIQTDSDLSCGCHGMNQSYFERGLDQAWINAIVRGGAASLQVGASSEDAG